MAKDVRIEKDSLGEIEVKTSQLWGTQTQRSLKTSTLARNAH